MGIERDGAVLRQLRTLFGAGTTRDLTDGQLLERFATDRGEAAEQAFAALVDRHGPMVLRVCRGVLADPNDAQDAFQATFLVLVRKARALWVRDSLGPWLHQVAFRTASCARRSAARRRRHERLVAESARETHAEIGDELGHLIHEEIDRLPDRYRAPLILCDLEGRTHEQAARHLGWPVGTVKSRQARGRNQLRQRLLRRGLGSDTGLIGPALLVPPALVDATTGVVVQFVLARATLRGPAATLAQEVLRSMVLARWLKVASVLAVAGATASGVGWFARGASPVSQTQSQGNPRVERIDDASVREVKPGKLRFEVIERGSLEPARARDAFCKVEGRITIISIRPEGSLVKKGDLICELDSAGLKDMLVNQQYAVKSAERAYQQAKLATEIAEIGVAEYLEATIPQERNALNAAISAAHAAFLKANTRLGRTRTARRRVKEAMTAKAAAATPSDIVAELDIDDRLDVAEKSLERERTAVEEAKGKLEMFERYISKKTADERKIEVEHKRSDELARLAAARLEKTKEGRILAQIEDCKIYADFDGRVILANDPGRISASPQIEEGATIRERQKIFSLVSSGDPLRVNAKIHESLVDRIRQGQRAEVTVDAFPNEKWAGVVTSVAPLPDPTSQFRAAPKVYTALIEIDKGASGLRPGMTARVGILVADLDDVLSVPLKAVVNFDGKDHVAIKEPGGGFDWREVTLGVSNEQVVEIKHGLKSGDVVILEPLAMMGEGERRRRVGPQSTPAKPDAPNSAPE